MIEYYKTSRYLFAVDKKNNIAMWNHPNKGWSTTSWGIKQIVSGILLDKLPDGVKLFRKNTKLSNLIDKF